MGDLLDKLEKEEKQEFKSIKLQKSELADILLKNLKEIFNFAGNYRKEHPYRLLDCQLIDYKTKELNSKISPVSEDILFLCYAIADFQDIYDFREIAGLYINRLILISKEQKFILCIEHLDTMIDFIGKDNNGKHINVIGNLGCYIGLEMKRGNLTINGNVDSGGYGMLGGTIVINGVCADAGKKMYGGKIICNGNFSVNRALGSSYKNKSGFGCDSEGGKIYLNGDYEIIPANTKSDIYHKGKLISKAGKPVNNDNFWYNELYNAYVPKQNIKP